MAGVKVMNGSYGAFNNTLMSKDPYNKIIADAECDNVYYENIDGKFNQYVDEWYKNASSEDREKDQNGADLAGKYARSKVKQAEPVPNVSSFEGKAIDVSTVLTKCSEYQDLIDNVKGLVDKLNNLKEKLGKEKLSVDGLDYESRIDEIINLIKEKYTPRFQEFVDAVGDRAQFVHDFQVAVQVDWYRYYDDESHYSCGKSWSRVDKGWFK